MNVLRLMTVVAIVLTSLFGALRGVSADGGTEVTNGPAEANGMDSYCFSPYCHKPDLTVSYIYLSDEGIYAAGRKVEIRVYNHGIASGGFWVYVRRTTNG